MKTLIYLLAFMLLVACSNSEKVEKENPPQTVRVFKVGEYNPNKDISISGVIKEKKTSGIAFRIAGPIHKFPVEIGDYVKKGDLIAEIDPRDYKLAVEAVEAKYEQVKNDVDRIKALYKTKSIPKSEYDKAISGMRQVTSSMTKAKNALKDTRLVAPFGGYIEEKYSENYETVGAGRAVVSMLDMKNLVVESEISSALYLQKRKFNAFTCYPVDLPEQSFKMKLAEASKKSNSGQLFKLRFNLENNSKMQLYPGMSVNVVISEDINAQHITEIPRTCIFSENDKTYVFLVKKQRIHKKEVKVIRINIKSQVEVKGVTTGDQIVSAGVKQLKENQEVKVLKKASKTNVGGLL